MLVLGVGFFKLGCDFVEFSPLSLTCGGAVSDCEDCFDFPLWLRKGKGLTATTDNSGSAVSRSNGEDGNAEILDNDRIGLWEDRTNGFSLTQTAHADKPLYDTSVRGALQFRHDGSTASWMVIPADKQVVIGAGKNFSIFVQAKPSVFGGALMGSSSTQFIKLVDANSMEIQFHGMGESQTATREGSFTLNKVTNYIITRCEETTTIYVDLNSDDKALRDQLVASLDETGGAFTINRIGAAADDVLGWVGDIRHVAIWNCKCLDADERNMIYEWAERYSNTSDS